METLLVDNEVIIGSFRGLIAFQTLLKTNLNINVSLKRLQAVFKNEPLYLIHQRRKPIVRRHYDLHYYGELVQADLSYMFDYDGFKYFLLAVDCFSSKVFVQPLKSKEVKQLVRHLKKFLKNFMEKYTN